MAGKIDEMTPASPLDPESLLEVSEPQGTSPETYLTKSTTAQEIADLANAYTDAEIAALSASVNIPAMRFTIDRDSTADSDPGAGLVKFNNATPNSATFLYFDDSTSDSIDLSTYFGTLGTTGFVKFQSAADAGEWMIWRYTAVTDGTGYFKFAVTLQASKGTLDDADAVLVQWDSDANTGSGGTELKGLTFTSDTGSTADSDPGAGLMKWNNATQSSATQLFFDNTTLDSITITSFFAALGTNGTLFMQQSDDATKWQLWEIDTATADSGYYDFAVTLLAYGGAIADDKTVYCNFAKGPGSSSGGSMTRVTVSDNFTRPNDTTAYAAGDAVMDSTGSPTMMEFTGCAQASGGYGTVLSAVLNLSVAPVTKGDYALHLFHTSPTPPNDNAALNLSDSDALYEVGFIYFPSTAYATTPGANMLVMSGPVHLDYKCAGGSTSLYGLLTIANAAGYTPTAQEVYTITLHTEQQV